MTAVHFAPNDSAYLEKLNALGEAAEAAVTAVRYDVQALSDPQRQQVKENIGITFVSPMDHGAVGNGVADDTTAVQAAMDAALAAGLPVHFPGGTYLVSGLTFGAGADLLGSGFDKTIIKLADNSGVDVLCADDAYDLFGGGSSDGTNEWRIQGITIDGNASNQSPADPDACNGIAFYSAKFVLRDVVIKNVAGHGIRSEWYTYGENSGGIEAFLSNVTIDTVGRHGWWNNGPHDLHAESVVIIDASAETDNTWCGIYASTKSSGRYFNAHVWHRAATTNRVQYGFSSNGGNELVACHFEGGRKQLQHRSNWDRVIGCNLFAHNGAAGTALVSFEGNENIHSACRYSGTNGTSMYALEFKSSASGNIVVGAYFNGFDISSPLLFTADGGGNRISGIGYCASGGSTSFGGTKAASTLIDYDQGGTAIVSRPTALIPAGALGTPGLAIIGDTNTGIAQTAGADTLNFIVGGASFAGADSTGVTFTLVPKAPTASVGTNTTQLATTAFVLAALSAPGAIGGVTPGAAAFTTISASDQVTSTVSTGTAPFVVASTTNVANLNASSLSGATFASPGAIGGGTPGAATFTTLTATGQVSLGGAAGAESFRAAVVPGAVNFIQAFGGAAGTGPTLYANGSDANPNFIHSLKGGGSHLFYTWGTSVIQFAVAHTASAANFPQVTGGAAGNPVVASAQGSDSHIDFAVTPKGANGRVRFGTHSALGAETVTGYIEIKDSGGTTRKLAVVS